MNTSDFSIRSTGPAGPADGFPGDAYLSLWELRRAAADPIAFLGRQAARGDLVRFYLRAQPVYLISHPALVEQVLVAQADKFRKAPALQRAARLLGNGLLVAEPPLHGERRRVMLPAFHRQRFESYADVMVEHAVRTRDAWTDGEEINLSGSMTSLALGIVGDTLFGTSLAPYERKIGRVLASALASLDPLVALVAPRRRLQPARDRLLAIVTAIVDERRRRPGARVDLLGLLLEANAGASDDEQLIDDVLTMLLAGHDTIANAMTWAWTSLAMHPACDARLSDEVRSVVGDRAPRGSDVQVLPYARAVMSEALRLRPPAWLLARRAIEDVPLDGSTVPAGAIVLMSPFLVHRDPRFFDDPLAFKPERWIGGERMPPQRLAFFPFGAGRRSCIGEHFAWMEGVLVLATLAGRWRFELTAGPGEVDLRVTMRPRGAVRAICRARRAVPAAATATDDDRVGREVRRVLRQRVPGLVEGDSLPDSLELGADGLGLDSVAVVELLLEYESLFGVRLPPDVIDADKVDVGSLVTVIDAALRAGADCRPAS